MAECGMKYDREAFLSAKNFILAAANEAAVANASVHGADFGELEYDYSINGSSAYLKTAFVAAPPTTEFTKFDLDLVTSVDELVKDAYLKLHDFNEKMSEMVSAISKNLDPDLEEIIKNIEAEAAKDYINYAMNGGVLDALQIYELFKRCDPDTLGLDEDQRALFDYLFKTGNDISEYEKMDWYEKLGLGAAVFGLSVVDGAVKVVENVVDGAITLGAGAVSLGAWLTEGEEARDSVLASAAEIVDVDWAEDRYGDIINHFGINEYVAYGAIHKAGVGVGKLAGNTLLGLIPGGAATKAAIAVTKAAGTSMEKTKDNENATLIGRFGTAALSAGVQLFSSVGNSIIDNQVKQMTSLDPFMLKSYKLPVLGSKAAVRAVATGGSSYVDYRQSGTEGTYGEFMKENGIDYLTQFGGQVISDAAGFDKNAAIGLKKFGGVNKDLAEKQYEYEHKFGTNVSKAKGKYDDFGDSVKQTTSFVMNDSSNILDSDYLGHADEDLSETVQTITQNNITFGNQTKS